MRVYLAGKISAGDWRTTIFGPRPMSMSADDINAPWGEEVIPGTSHVAVGPWFVSCDHGCAHGPNTHGVGATGEAGCVDAIQNDHECLNRRQLTVDQCLLAIRRCDLFFAWLEPFAYGTVTELGYAKALGKMIVVGVAESAGDLWFAKQMADKVVVGKDAASTLLTVLRLRFV